MTQKKLIILLTILCFSLLFLYVVSFIFDKTSPEKVTSALVNPKYAEEIKKFSVESTDGSLEFFLFQDVWFGVKENMVFPLFQGVATELIENLTKIREMYVITKKASKEDLKNFSLDENNSVKIKCETLQGESIATVYFGSHNFSGDKIYVRGKTSTVYEIQDEFFSWLSVSPRQWADMELIPKSLVGNIDSKDIQRISVSFYNESKVSYPSSVGYEDFSNTILSLRAGNIFSKKEIILDNQIGSIELDLGTGGKIILSFYQNNQENSVYYVDFQGVTGVAEKEKTELLNKGDYILEISAWTFNRIIELFNNLA